MSENSESVHLRSSDPKEAVELLRRAKVSGFVFPTHNGWVSLVHASDPDNRMKIEEANKGLLLFYDYAGDHGLWVNVHEGKKRVARIKAAFDRPNFAFDRAAFERLGLLSSLGAGAVDAWVKRAHVWHERSRAEYLIAERLGLPRYKWWSYSAETQRTDPARIEVRPDGSVKAPPPKVAPHVAVADPPGKKGKAKPSAKKKAAPAKKKTGAKKPAAKARPKPKPKKAAAKPKKKSR